MMPSAQLGLRARLTAVVVVVVALVMVPFIYAGVAFLEKQARAESERYLVATNWLVLDLVASQYDSLDATLARLGNAIEAYFSGRVVKGREPTGGAPELIQNGARLMMASDALEAFASGANDIVASIYLGSAAEGFVSVASSARVGGVPLVGDVLRPPPSANEAMKAGAPWRGTLRVEGRMRLVRLLPFTGANRELLGFYLIGLELADELKELREHLGGFRVGKTGYIFVIDAGAGPGYGEAIVHPAKQGMNLLNDAGELGRQVVGEMLMQHEGVLSYDWRNDELGESAYRRKIAAFATIERLDWLIGVSGYEDEFNSATIALRNSLIGALLVMAVLLAAALNLAIGRLVIRPMLRLQRTLRTLSRGNETLVHSVDEASLLSGICDVLVRTGGFPLARISLLDAHGELVTGAEAGHAARFGRHLAASAGRGADPQEAVVQSRRIVHLAPIPETQPALATAAHESGCKAIIAFPLCDGDRAIGALTIGAAAVNDLDHAGVDLLHELAEDLAFGIVGQRSTVARRAAEAALQLRERAIEASSDGVFIVDIAAPRRPVRYANPAMELITGLSRDDLVGCDAGAIGGFNSDCLKVLRAALDEARSRVLELEGRRPDGDLFWCECSLAPVQGESGSAAFVVGVIKDVTERTLYLRQLEHQAKFDSLTGLPNRALLDDRLNQLIIANTRHSRSLGVAFIDLDHFKLINDNVGHRHGDRLLQAVAARLMDVLREGDTAARQGGDEFVVLLPDLEDEQDCYVVLSRIREALKVPITVDGRDFVITCSIGVSLCPKDGEDADTLLKNADIAMYGAKDAGRDAIRFFKQEMNAQVQDRVALEQALRVALERDELHLVYQPQIDAVSGRVAGAEALLRWRHPELGLVPPVRFIPVTEELGLIGVIGEWVLREACRQAADWRSEGRGDLVIAVNVSARQLAEPDLPERVMAILAETGLPAHLLELELTESMLMGNVERSETMLHNLKQIGVTLSLDDFGTGYSSFAYLRRFPIDTVKIDQTFVRDMGEGASNAESIVSAIIAMAHSLKMRVVAEGVETPLQQRQLVRHGCDVLQGYLLGRPSLADQFDHRPRPGTSAEE